MERTSSLPYWREKAGVGGWRNSKISLKKQGYLAGKGDFEEDIFRKKGAIL